MKLHKLGNNETEVTIGNVTLFFSYSTPVAGYDGNGAFRTEEKFSVTTSRHINSYLGKGIGRVVPQNYIEALVK